MEYYFHGTLQADPIRFTVTRIAPRVFGGSRAALKAFSRTTSGSHTFTATPPRDLDPIEQIG
jgi:hypothetical protein